jgi:hypothetical protein
MPTDYRPHIHGRVLTPTITPIHVYIICDADGTPAVGTDTVNAWVAEANRIYRQAAMSFTVASVEHVYGHSDWFDLDSSVKFTELCSYASETGGLEVYCVGEITFVSAFGIHSDQNFGGKDPRRGIAIKAAANLNTLAHEIGHACGLRDIRYPFVGDSVSVDFSGTSNWSGGEDTGYHPPNLEHDELVRWLLMYYMGNAQKSDIAIGEIIGTNPDMQIPYLIGVGLNDMGFREPRH